MNLEVLNKILEACGLESRTRWIDLGSTKEHRYNDMCSNCGITIHKRILPSVCPNCKSQMKERYI